jgi:hypothetical protein
VSGGGTSKDDHFTFGAVPPVPDTMGCTDSGLPPTETGGLGLANEYTVCCP